MTALARPAPTTWWSAALARRDAMGPSEERMHAALAVFGGWMKTVTVAVYTVVAAIAWVAHSRGPVQALAVMVVVGGALVGWALVRRKLFRPTPVWIVDAVLAAAPGASVLILGTPTASSWTLRVAAVAATAAQLEWARRPAAAWTMSLVAVGSLAAATGAVGGAGAATVTVGVVVQFVLTALVVMSIRFYTRRIDDVAARTEQERRDAEVTAARQAAERLELATLHDTACTTLLMVSGGAASDGADWLPARARRDLDALLGESASLTGTVDLAEMIAPVADECAVPMALDLDGPLLLPAHVASAVLDGVREAVQNVNRHSHARSAQLRGGVSDEQVWVELTDDGVGFRPADVSVHCRGISGSIVGRMRDAGGHAAVDSVEGDGTTVRWSYP